MLLKNTNTLEYLLHGAKDATHQEEASLPSTTTIMVSLFLILVTFFMVLNKNADHDPLKSKAVIENIQTKFGKPTDKLEAFGSVVPPKVQEYTLELQRLLGENAKVEATIDGTKTIVIITKDVLFYADETELREDKILLAQKTSAILKKIHAGKPIKIDIIAGSQNYKFDIKKLEALKNAIGITDTNIGIDTNEQAQNQFKLVVENEQ